MAGCQHVPLNPLYTARELDFILRDAQPALLIADEASSALVALLAAAQGIRLLDGAAARAWTIPSDETPAAGRRRGRAGAAAIHRRHHRPAQGRHPEPGRHRHQCVPARSCAHAPRRRDVLCAMPLFHSYGMAMGCSWRPAPPRWWCCRATGPTMFDAVARERHAVPRQPDDLCRPDGACALRADRLVQRARLLFAPRHWPRKRCGAGRPRWARRSMKAMARPRPAPS